LNTLLQSALLGFLYGVFELVAWVARISGWRRDLLRRNLARCLPELEPSVRSTIEAASYRHIGQLVAEFLGQRWLDRNSLAARIRLEQDSPLHAALAGQCRVLILSAHHSNWEWLLQRCSTAFGQPLTAAYKPTRRAWVDQRLRALRECQGCRMITAQELVPHLLAQRGQVRLLAMLADQSPAVASDQQSWLELAAAGSRKEPDEILSAYAQALEQHVREYPAEYFWAYNRWKREKPLYG
jgi:KDO2-lipid IV(A) lauroyltransferase